MSRILVNRKYCHELTGEEITVIDFGTAQSTYTGNIHQVVFYTDDTTVEKIMFKDMLDSQYILIDEIEYKVFALDLISDLHLPLEGYYTSEEIQEYTRVYNLTLVQVDGTARRRENGKS